MTIAPKIVPCHLNPSEWVQQFDCRHVKPLIVCRGPVRLEAIEVFQAMGIEKIGILLSDKDSQVYDDCRAPERYVLPPECVHRIEDYQSVGPEGRQAHIQQIIGIAKTGGYNAIFAGYGFMAESADFVQAVTEANLRFIGPSVPVVMRAGQKDDAKQLAREVGVSTTAGIDDLAARALLRQLGTREAIESHPNFLQQWNSLSDQSDLNDLSDLQLAEHLLNFARNKNEPLLSFDVFVEQAIIEIKKLRQAYPNRILRFKAVGGGGGKGQRLLPIDVLDSQLPEWLPEVFHNVLNEVGATNGNENILIELNIDQSRHQEIQLVGNGQWCIALGGRDCSVQWQDQKLVELSITELELENTLLKCADEDQELQLAISQELKLLRAMEHDAVNFGRALGLDSVSTFECLVSEAEYAFMELNARLQVEHRVTEQCYTVCFSNPDNASENFQVQSLIELMVLLAFYGPLLPEPVRVALSPAAAEVRMNATDSALAPHVGGLIRQWKIPQSLSVLVYDQGISNRVSNQGMPYRLAGAYDSNIALLIVQGSSRKDCLRQVSELISSMSLSGDQLETNLFFHQGLLCWLQGQCVYPRVPTHITGLHLQAVALSAAQVQQWDIASVWRQWVKAFINQQPETHHEDWKQISEALSSLAVAPLTKLLSNAHLLYGWLSLSQDYLILSKLINTKGVLGSVQSCWRAQPSAWLKATIKYLGLESSETVQGLWPEDQALLDTMIQFYDQLYQFLKDEKLTNQAAGFDLSLIFSASGGAENLDQQWQAIQQNHAAYGLIFGFWQWLLVSVHRQGQILQLNRGGDLMPVDFEHGPEQLGLARSILSPPPEAPSNEIVAPTGGLYYAQPSPGQPPFVQKGQSFRKGDTLCILEVMKMFNPVKAEFDGTIEAVLVGGTEAVVVRKGQSLFEVSSTQGPKAVKKEENTSKRLDVEIKSWFEIEALKKANHQVS